jgi:hypothetical protein
MSWWDGIASDLWNWFWAATLSWLSGTLDTVFGYLPSLLTQPQSFSGSPAYHVWLTIWAMVLAGLGIAVAGLGLYYITTSMVERKAALKELWTKLLAALVLSAASVTIADMAISLSNALTSAIVPSLSFSSGALSNTGPLALIVDLIALFLILVVLIEMGVRVLMVFFAGAILPIGYVLWAFPITSSYGTKIVKMFFEWTFLNVFMGISLLLTVTVASGLAQGGSSSQFEAAFIILAGLALTAAMPKVMTESGAAVSSVGQAVLGGMVSAEGIGGGGPAGMAGGMGANPAGGAAAGGSAAGGMGRAIGSAGRMGMFNPVAGAAALGAVGLVAGAKALHGTASHLKARMQPNYHAVQANKQMSMAKSASAAGNIAGADKHFAKAGKHLEKQMDGMSKKPKFDAMVKWARQSEWAHPHGGGAA